MAKGIRRISWCLLVGATVLFTSIGLMSTKLPDGYLISENVGVSTVGTDWIYMNSSDVTQVVAGDSPSAVRLSLFGCIPVKEVSVAKVEAPQVYLSGVPFGLKMYTRGVVVVGTNAIVTDKGSRNPGKEGGIQKGDVVITVDGAEVESTEHMKTLLQGTTDRAMTVGVVRQNMVFEVKITPAKDNEDGKYKVGLWVRDSSAGIGTMTYYAPDVDSFGGLGHGVCDVDTGRLLPLSTGEIVPVKLTGVIKGSAGVAGELHGKFQAEVVGQLSGNTDMGVFGAGGGALKTGDMVDVALKQEVMKGACQIYTTVDETGPQYYDAEIRSIDYGQRSVKNMVIQVTDSRLIDKTGGIVRGMSGSPIVQNGKLIGAVTHVFVGDSTTGYGIFAENMINH